MTRTKLNIPEKQSLYDFYKENIKEIMQNAKNAFLGNGKLTIIYPSGFKYELREEDFPNRSIVFHYGKNRAGKRVIVGWERDSPSLPPLYRPDEREPEMQHAFSRADLRRAMQERKASGEVEA